MVIVSSSNPTDPTKPTEGDIPQYEYRSFEHYFKDSDEEEEPKKTKITKRRKSNLDVYYHILISEQVESDDEEFSPGIKSSKKSNGHKSSKNLRTRRPSPIPELEVIPEPGKYRYF
jgi:hypothetical protein